MTGGALALAISIVVGGIATGAPAEAPDPYLWLEQVEAPRAMAWVEAENSRSLGILEGDPRFAALQADALAIVEATDKIPMPRQRGDTLVNFWQDATHVRGLWRATTPDSYRGASPVWRTLIDLDALAAAEHANWVWHGAECDPLDPRRCLVMLSDGGEDADTLREFDLAAGRFVADGFALPKSKQTAAWQDADTLIVARDWGAGTMTASGYPFVVKQVRRGQPLAAATELFRGEPSDVAAQVASYADGEGRRVAIIQRGVTFFESEVYVIAGDKAVRLDLPRKADVQGLLGGRLIVQLNEAWTPANAGGAAFPAGALVAVDPDGVAPAELVFVPGPRQSIDAVAVTRGRVLASVYDNVRGRAMSFARRPDGGWSAATAALPDNASVDIVSTSRLSDEAYVAVQSFLVPTSLWSLDARTAAATRLKATPARFDTDGLVTEQFTATSKDGTQVPYFLVHRRDARPSGDTPTLLNAYGGFQVSMTPFYGAGVGKLWLERGGAFALANIRGGGEFGPAWHEAALKLKRQNAYDDFAAVARDLVTRRITSPRRLGIFGGSNGGLLMGVAMTQHPDYWNAVAIEVPLLDMLRYEQLSAGASWVGEYGSVADPAERANLARISPYNNLARGVAYPEPFIWTTTKDDRVGPVQARKFAARMKEYGLPYLYWENTEGGHAGGANLKQRARAEALEMTYFTRRLMDPQVPAEPRP